MVTPFTITLDNGQTKDLAFSFYTLKEMAKFPHCEFVDKSELQFLIDEFGSDGKDVEDTVRYIQSIYTNWQKLFKEGGMKSLMLVKDIIEISSSLRPVIFAGIHTLNDLNKRKRVIKIEEVMDVVNHLDVPSITQIISQLTVSVFPQGLPKDEVKKKEPVKKSAPRGKK